MIDRLSSNVAIMEPKDGLQEKLALSKREGRPLKIKLGFDPTAPDLHLGHAVVLRKLRDFQEAGHHIIIIIGDFTASIGDPTGRNRMRPPLSKEDIAANCETYINQLGLVVDTQRVEIRHNSEWLGKMDLREMIKLISRVTVAQIMQRDDFKKRFRSDVPIHMHELLYPIMQGYDSVVINADIELGGTDQLFNNLMGRTLQEAFDKPGQAVLTSPLLVGLDGSDKMSKTAANYVGLTDEPENMYGKIMSVPDKLIPDYLNLATDFDAAKQAELNSALLEGTNPMLVKKDLAANVVAQFHSSSAATAAAEHFERTVQRRDPKESDHEPISLAKLRESFESGSPSLLELCDFVTTDMSRSGIRRLIRGGGVRVDRQKIADENTKIELVAAKTLWVGKLKKFILVD
ncbi:MAG: tyrosine--tRNA ligase [Myxococcota bacterium]